MGSNVIVFFRKRVSATRKTAFLSAFLFGLCVHLFKFTNTLPNLDSLQNFYSRQNVLASGRWFLEIACAPSSFFDLPWVTGILSLVWIALATILIVEIFRIQNPVLVALTGFFMASFPAVTEVFFYQYTADGYMLALLLASVAVYCTQIPEHRISRWICGAVCLILCCGIYQSYVSFALVLAIAYFIRTLLEMRYDTKTQLRWIAKQAGLYGVSLAADFGVWKLCMLLQHVEPTNYQGIDRLGTLQISGLPEKIKQVVLETGFYFLSFVPGRGKAVPFWAVLHVIFLLFFAGILLYSIRQSGLYRKKSQLALLFAAAAAIPFAAFMWLFATSDMTYMGFRMKHSFCVLYILAAVLFEQFTRLRWKNAMGALLAVMILSNSLSANIHYFYFDRMWDKSYAAAAEMVMRLHEADDGTAKYLVIVGREANATSPNYIDKGSMGYYYYHQLNTLLRDEENTALFLGNVLEFSLKYYTDHPDETPNFVPSETSRHGHMNSRFSRMEDAARAQLIVSDAVRTMNNWPARDSVRRIGDALVVKFSDETPKKQ